MVLASSSGMSTASQKLDSTAGWLPNLALGLLCLRLAVPTATLGSEVTYQLLLANKYETSQAQIMSAEVPDIEAQTEEGLGEGFKRLLVEITNIEKNIEALKARADGWITHIVRLTAVFIVQTVVLPLLFLWVMLWLYRALSAPFYSRNLQGRTEHHVPK